MKQSLKDEYRSSLKSMDTEEHIDLWFYRPLGFLWAKFFAWLGVTPNWVTIASIFLGVAGGVLFYFGQPELRWLNYVGILLIIWANSYDSADGQLARMTQQYSRLGRILDGVAGFTWFTPIYLALVWRFYHHHDIEFSLLGISDTEQNVMIATIVVFIIGLISGIHGLAGQQRLADYYIQAHLYFLKGEKGSELDNSAQQQEIYDKMDSSTSWVERLFQKSYIGYTQKQEGRTPQFQRLLRLLKTKFGTAEHIPATVREEFHQNSLPLMPWNGLLTFNFRSAWLFLFCLIDIPVGNFLFEIICMGLLTSYVNHRHENFCRKIADKVEKDAA